LREKVDSWNLQLLFTCGLTSKPSFCPSPNIKACDAIHGLIGFNDLLRGDFVSIIKSRSDVVEEGV
jgi:hypothetical protein